MALLVITALGVVLSLVERRLGTLQLWADALREKLLLNPRTNLWKLCDTIELNICSFVAVVILMTQDSLLLYQAGLRSDGHKSAPLAPRLGKR